MDRHQLSAFIESKRQEIVLSNDPSSYARFLKVEAELTQALPIWFDIWGCLALRNDLTVVANNSDWKDSVTIEIDQAILNFVYSLASRRYPELEALRPVKPQQARDCTYVRVDGITRLV